MPSAISTQCIYFPNSHARAEGTQKNSRRSIKDPKLRYEDQLESHVITIYHKGAAITENLDRLVHHEIHKPALKAKLMKDNDWTEEQIESIAWEEFYSALRKVQRSHPISVTKITH